MSNFHFMLASLQQKTNLLWEIRITDQLFELDDTFC